MRSSKQAKPGLIFDLDGTLYDAEKAYGEALAAVGLHTQDDAYLVARKAVKSNLPAGHVGARNRLLYFKKFLEINGTFSPVQLLEMMSRYEEALRVSIQKQWEFLKRSKLLADLAERYRLLILTNENLRTQLIKLTALGASFSSFDGLVTSDEMGEEKPSPLMFTTAAHRIERELKDCIVVGDSVEADILPALALGCRAIWTTEFLSDNEKTAAQRKEFESNSATMCIQKLDDLILILEQPWSRA